MIALTPRQHDALAAYCITGDYVMAADYAHMNEHTLRSHLVAVRECTDEAISTVAALYARGWIAIPARPGAIPARVSSGFASRSGTESGGPRDASDPSDEGPQ